MSSRRTANGMTRRSSNGWETSWRTAAATELLAAKADLHQMAECLDCGPRSQLCSPHGAKRNAGAALPRGRFLPGLRFAPSGLRHLRYYSPESNTPSVKIMHD